MIKDNYELEVLVNGKPVKEYLHDGKFYIEGKKGTKYNLRIKNNGYSRILVVPSVDGLNVISGKVSSTKDRGYIVEGNSSVTIDGWRTSNREVAEFFFSESDKSYGSKKGKDNNLGVIGCAVFKEKQISITNVPYIIDKFIDRDQWPTFPKWPILQNPNYPINTPDYFYRSFSASYNSSTNKLDVSVNNNGVVQNAHYNLSTGKPIQQEIGTGFGDKKHSESIDAEFERSDSPEVIMEIFYNSKSQLEKMGINLNSTSIKVSPSAFPIDRVESGYCKPPEEE